MQALDLELSFKEVELYQMVQETILKEAQVKNIIYIDIANAD